MIAVVTVGLLATLTATSPAQQSGSHTWLGAQGEPLPFQSDEEILDFLNTAEVVSLSKIPTGVTHPRKALLEKDGVQLHAVVHNHDQTLKRVRMSDGRFRMNLHDYALFQVAAYRMARLLGLDNVPPAVERRIDGKKCSVQMWVEGTMTEEERTKKHLRAPKYLRWRHEVQNMYIFDALIGNDDPNAGNILYEKDSWKLWMIDHTRSFQISRSPWDLSKIVSIDRQLWENLQALDQAAVKERAGKILSKNEIASIFKRRQQLIEHIQGLIDERGEGAVIFVMG
ncbi:MAG: hypothetical protein ACE5HV_03050 [Acidobacteriota bacterium]